MPVSVKMAESELALYKKEKRRENRSKVRQALFVSDYVFYKHFDLYQEAAQLYNQINHLYPRKPDLRRMVEFRAWRNGVTGQPSIGIDRRPTINQQTYVFPPHADIPVAEVIDPSDSFTVAVQPESQRPAESPQSERPQSESPQPESQRSAESPQSERPQSESPQPESQRPAESPQPERPQSESPVRPIKGNKVMELKIQLISSPKKDNLQPAIYTETLQTVTEEIIQEGDLEPSLHEEISPEIIEKIMDELRQDPGLKDIITSVEEQIELEEVGMDIDFPDDEDRLEAELENMIFW